MGLGRGALTSALVHKFGACDKDGVEVVVRAILANLEFASLGSTPWLPVGESRCEHGSLSCRWSSLRRDHSISVLRLPSLELGHEG